MPDQRDDEDLVPPMKVMRKRLNGVYRADTGFAGPTRRYVLIVAMLVGLASLPTLAAITAGSRELSGGRTDTMDIPFLPAPSSGPVRPQPSQSQPSQGPQASPGSVSGAAQGASKGADAAVRAGRLIGQAGQREPSASGDSDSDGPSAPARTSQRDRKKPRGDSRDGGSRDGGSRGGGSPGGGSRDGGSPGGGSRDGGSPGGGSRDGGSPGGGSRDGGSPGESPSDGGTPRDVPDGRDVPHDGEKPDEGHDNPAHWGRKPTVPDLPTVPDESADVDEPADVEEPADVDEPDEGDDPGLPSVPGLPEVPDDPETSDRPRDRPCEESRRSKQSHRSVARHRSRDRSEHSRRSAVAERSNNIRPSSILERSYANSGDGNHARRLIPEARSEENQIANRSYRGSHRASSLHHADDQTAEQQRSSRVGRHHAEPSEDLSGRW